MLTGGPFDRVRAKEFRSISSAKGLPFIKICVLESISGFEKLELSLSWPFVSRTQTRELGSYIKEFG